MQFSGQGAGEGALGGAAAGAAIGLAGGPIGALVGAGLGAIGGGLFLHQNSNKKTPSWNYQAPSGKQMFQDAASQAMQYAPQITQENIDLQNKVTPGSSDQREQALKQLNAYIQGNVPQDVQQNIQRQVAQNLGGGFNAFTGGGQAPQNFARNIGQTSLGLSQYGLSAAPTWQQLANSMVASPTQLLGSAMQAQLYSAGLGMQGAESSYQAGMNQYDANQLAQQNQSQQALSLAYLGLQGYSAINKANYLNSLTPSTQGRLATTAGLPAVSGYGSGPSYTPTQMSAGWGLSPGEF